MLFPADLMTGLKTSNGCLEARIIPGRGIGFMDKSTQNPVKSVQLSLAIFIMPQGILGNELLLNSLV